MKKEKWTLFGAGDFFIDDIINAIEANDGIVIKVVYNHSLSLKLKKKLLDKRIKIIPLEKWKPNRDNYFFGFVNSNKKPFLGQLKKFEIKLSNLIHPFSYVAPTSKIGQGNFIGAGSVIASHVTFGNFNFVNRSVSIGHHCKLKDFNHIGPGVTISGRCQVGDNNFVGAGSTCIDGLTIKNDIIIGAGSVILSNINEPGTYVGIPAKRLKK